MTVGDFSEVNLVISIIVLVISLIGLFIALINREEKIDEDTKEHIKQKLHKLYYPLRRILNQYDDISEQKLQNQTYYSNIRNDMQEIIQYSYLSSNALEEPLNSFISFFDKNAALMVKNAREQFEKQKKNGSEKIATEIGMRIYFADYLSKQNQIQSLTIPPAVEAEKAVQLYHEILEIIEQDIMIQRAHI
ncbi:hypothetical protein RG963_01670 [Methanosarcina sp. Z-7115]|uniref:Uncharacterized protein n=1 Tax=Methanosarcina baikalica TaxID=3073890 RepID=A0ABU2CXP7_9EURY|nr:hypothetical protein [Methanosarcina sp. Z-7115]MDR7664510.1 hypothetical protein [Methanosarcina sp. Z-7115]